MKEIPRDFIQSYKEPFGFKAALGQSAVAFAALFKENQQFRNKNVGVILSGGNVDLSKLPF